MSPARRILLSATLLATVAAPAALAGSAHAPVGASAQSDAHAAAHAQQPGAMPMTGHHAFSGASSGVPTLPGQDAFGTLQEIVRILEADPTTDWSKVNLEALRQHLIDMNDVTLRADAVARPIDGGIEIAITGTGRTVEAIRRMVPAHAQEIDRTQLNGWRARTDPLPDGVLLTVTSSDPQQVTHIRGLGFIGIMVSGSHHQLHHLAMAKGEPMTMP